ncbi:MAG: hypothetical protein AAF415_10805 [Pseudomonadota bacterium]
MAEPVHFLLHIPKCAGTTVEAHFARHLGTAFRLAPRWDSVSRNFIGNRYPGVEMQGIRAVSGHSLSVSLKQTVDAPVRESVLLRDPLGYFLSFYNYRWARHAAGDTKPPDFAPWYLSQRRNPISRFLLNRYFEQGVPALYRFSSAGRLAWLEDRLRQFHFVGSYRYADEMVAGISRELGIPDTVTHENVTPVKKLRAQDLDPALQARIIEENAVDQVLYTRWADRRWQGEPDMPKPNLPRADHLRYALGDSIGGIAKKLLR